MNRSKGLWFQKTFYGSNVFLAWNAVEQNRTESIITRNCSFEDILFPVDSRKTTRTKREENKTILERRKDAIMIGWNSECWNSKSGPLRSNFPSIQPRIQRRNSATNNSLSAMTSHTTPTKQQDGDTSSTVAGVLYCCAAASFLLTQWFGYSQYMTSFVPFILVLGISHWVALRIYLRRWYVSL
jgi:hypothetical protein